jgi:uncharacterized membrane protein
LLCGACVSASLASAHVIFVLPRFVDFYAESVNVSLVTVRMFVHVLAAVVWVGGQVVLAGLMPAVRGLGEDAPRRIARQFAKVSWPALLVVTFTGIWNALEINFGEANDSYRTTFGLKMACYVITAFGAILHTVGPTVGRSQPKLRVPLLAVGGAFSLLGALGTLFFAVALKY